MRKRIEIWICGVGGQGVVFAANLLGQAASRQYSYVAATAHYGPESRGSSTSTELVISSAKGIDYPYIQSPSILVLMHQKAYDYIEQHPEAFTNSPDYIIYDSTLVSKPEIYKNSKISVIGVPATAIARDKFDNIVMANLILVGKLVQVTGIVKKNSLLRFVKADKSGSRQALEIGLLFQ
ncbi:MAG: 2-oxoacid:acceptor oxidoreductase family protein [Planctomycetota bacterium]